MRDHLKWISMAAIGLMLLSMLAYVASEDEALGPVSGPEAAREQPADQ